MEVRLNLPEKIDLPASPTKLFKAALYLAIITGSVRANPPSL
jgi:hypothetical protein